MIEISDAIGPATSNYFVRALEAARERNAQLIILQLDTPGGLDSAMRDMIRATLSSEVPVVTYVAPSGARAASAGTYLLYASHVAAMAPATNIGAATPVQIGAPSKPAPPKDADEVDKKRKDQPPEEAAPQSAGERKAVNDAVAYIRGLAELRNRNADWAEAAVRSAVSLSARQALEERVIDVVAADVPDLLQQIDGRRVQAAGGEKVLATQALQIERIEPDWRTRVLAVLTNPNVAYLLMLAGIYGLLLEGYNPGAILPGVVGAISLLLALYAFQVLPVNYAGLGLMILGLGLMTAEAFAPSFGVLGLGGIVAFVVGSIILLDTSVPGFQVARALIGGVALTGGVVFLLTAGFLVRARRQKVATGSEQLLRETAVALEDFEHTGMVRLHGEIWRAHSAVPVRQGQRLRVLRVTGLTVEVELQ
ncbi:MAG TPA: nodulation protein NfeD [Steroidobacteraceae bacterium]|nr:nodulation protein NfeD [Steroidobacteraceae bacterium]